MSEPTSARAAVAQHTAGSDAAENLRVCKRLASEAADRGAALLSLPECFCFLGESERDKLAVAEVLDSRRPGPILEAMMEMATRHNMWVAGAGIPETIPEDEGDPEAMTWNSHAVVSPSGELAAVYRKIHLFDVDIPGKTTLRESAATCAGREPVALSTDLGKIGLSVCYDLRFPELFQELTMGHEAQILLVPSAFTAYTGAAHWHVLLRARAIETQCYVLAAAQSGRHNSKRTSFGHSMIVDPWGQVIAELESGTGVAVADIDLEFLRTTRRQLPCLEHKVLGRP